MAKKPTKKKPMTKEQELLFTDAFHGVIELVEEIRDEADANTGRLPCREFSLAFTRLEEAEMWLRRGFEEMGYKVPEPEEGDEEDEEDEGDEEDDEDEVEAKPKAEDEA